MSLFLVQKPLQGHHLAKVIIHGINLVAQKINNDERIRDLIKVVFGPIMASLPQKELFRQLMCLSRSQRQERKLQVPGT